MDDNDYRITRAEANKFREALEAAMERGASADVHPRIHQAMQDGLRSQLEELDEQLDVGAQAIAAYKRWLTSEIEKLRLLDIGHEIADTSWRLALDKVLGLIEQGVDQ